MSVVDPASVAVSWRSRRAKTDRIYAEMMLRTLLAWARGERGVCSMVRPPTPAEEDTRRLHREREALLAERIRHANRIKGLLATQGVFNFEPTGRKRRVRLGELRPPGGAELPARLRAELGRQLDRLGLTLQQLATVEAERDAMLAAGRAKGSASAIAVSACGGAAAEVRPMKPNQESGERRCSLVATKGRWPRDGIRLAGEAFFRDFRNRREVASYAGLTPSPWQSGGIDRDQGISKGGNGRLRRAMGGACKGSACAARGRLADGETCRAPKKAPIAPSPCPRARGIVVRTAQDPTGYEVMRPWMLHEETGSNHGSDHRENMRRAASASVHPTRQPAIAGIPAIKRLLTDPVAPTDIVRRAARFLPAQNTYDLRLVKPALSHRPSTLTNSCKNKGIRKGTGQPGLLP